MKRLFLIGLLALVGCTSTSTTPTVPSLEGIWSVSSGSEVLSAIGNSSLKFLQLNANGTGIAYAVQTDTNVLTCAPVVYSVENNSVVSFATSLNQSSTELYVFEKTDTSLKLSNVDGVNQNFAKAASVPADNQCETANVTRKLESLAIRPAGFAGLLSDGTNLRVADNNSIVQIINPTNGAIVTTENITGSSYRQVVTMQGATDYWAHCGCGGSPEIARFKVGVAPSDIIQTGTDLGNEISVRGAAFDGTNLWLGGYSSANSVYRILKVNSAAEPDVLLSSFDFKVGLNALTFHAGQLWGLQNNNLVLINPATAKAQRTVHLPDLNQGSYQGIASLGGNLFVMINNNNSSITILVVSV